MKLLTKDLLKEFGFSEEETKSNASIEVMSREGFDVVIKEDNMFFYSNQGIDYPLKDLTSLRKLFRETKRKELTVIVVP